MGFLENLAVKTAAFKIMQDADSYLESTWSQNENSIYGVVLAHKYGLPEHDNFHLLEPWDQLCLIFCTVFMMECPYVASSEANQKVFIATIVKNVCEKRVYTFLYDFVHSREALQRAALNREALNKETERLKAEQHEAERVKKKEQKLADQREAELHEALNREALEREDAELEKAISAECMMAVYRGMIYKPKTVSLSMVILNLASEVQAMMLEKGYEVDLVFARSFVCDAIVLYGHATREEVNRM